MNRVFSLKDVAYAAKVGGGVITGFNEADVLVDGAFAAFNDKGILIPVLTPAATLLDSKSVSIVHKRGSQLQVVAYVPRVGTRLDRTNYRAAVRQVSTVSALSIASDAVGDAVLQIKDVSFSSSSNFGGAINVSSYKKAGTSKEALVDDLVSKINASEPNDFIVASRGSTGDTSTLILTGNVDNVAFDVSLSSLLESETVAVTTGLVHSIGKGVDVLQMEKDASVEQGNSNFIDYTNEHYSQAMATDPAANYDCIALAWTGMHESPSANKPVMHNSLVIAVDATASTLDTDAVLAVLTPIFTGQFTTASGAEGAADDGTDTDGTAGN